MSLGLKCSCGHEFYLSNNFIELFVKNDLEHSIIQCISCKKETLIKRQGNKLSTHKVTFLMKDSNIAEFKYDTKPISSCYVPSF